MRGDFMRQVHGGPVVECAAIADSPAEPAHRGPPFPSSSGGDATDGGGDTGLAAGGREAQAETRGRAQAVRVPVDPGGRRDGASVLGGAGGFAMARAAGVADHAETDGRNFRQAREEAPHQGGTRGQAGGRDA
eukprot:ctg_204.g151